MRFIKVVVAALFLIGASSDIVDAQLSDGPSSNPKLSRYPIFVMGHSFLGSNEVSREDLNRYNEGLGRAFSPGLSGGGEFCGVEECYYVAVSVPIDVYLDNPPGLDDAMLFAKYEHMEWIASHFDNLCYWNNSPPIFEIEYSFESEQFFYVAHCKQTVVYMGGDPPYIPDFDPNGLLELLYGDL